jgi:arylsulfatase A
MYPTLSRRHFLHTLTAGSIASISNLSQSSFSSDTNNRLPNIVIIFADDQGYADAGCFGAKDFETPNIDKLAKGGMQFTDFYVAQPVCGASRAALLTGCYPNRIGMLGAPSHNSKHGINRNEMTLAELVKQKGYATAIYGKWHLGHHKQFLPTHHGFDEYFGLPYSNDMWPFHPERPHGYPPLPLIEGDEIIEYNPDQTNLTTWYTEKAVQFIDKNKDNPFFLYVPHSMPHVPLYVSDKFKGKSKQGMYGDVIMEIDWSVGQIVSTLEKHGIADNTLIIYCSDNGPWLSYGNHAGSALPLREGKGTTWDGGVREPTVMYWPNKIPKGKICNQPAMTIDIFPTIANIIGADLPNHAIDGKNITPLLCGEPGAKSPQEAYYFYWGNDLHAVRSGDWKLHFPHSYRTLAGKPGGKDGIPTKYTQHKTELALFNLKNDISESTDVSTQYPKVVEQLKSLADKARIELGDGKQKGKGIRPHGRIPS